MVDLFSLSLNHVSLFVGLSTDLDVNWKTHQCPHQYIQSQNLERVKVPKGKVLLRIYPKFSRCYHISIVFCEMNYLHEHSCDFDYFPSISVVLFHHYCFVKHRWNIIFNNYSKSDGFGRIFSITIVALL